MYRVNKKDASSRTCKKNDGMGKETNNCGAGEGPQIIYNVAGMYQFTSE